MIKSAITYRLLFGLLMVGIILGCQSPQPEAETVPDQPNIIYILADDLGYGDLGVYGQEKIETPNIDALAKNGMRFTQHYSGSPVCAPSRCVLLTGKHTGHAYIRGNGEWGERGEVWDFVAMLNDSTLEGQRPLPADTRTLPRVLKTAGYATGMIGKWGLGAPHTESIPTTMGFDYFYGYNCQRQAHTFYPVHLYENERRVYLQNDTVPPRTRMPEGADPYDMDNYAQFNLTEYSPDLMFAKLTQFVDKHADEPFFLYWATPIPHVPLQAPQQWVDYYVEKFGDEEPYLSERGYFPHRYPHAAYAAMISYLDEQVGQLVQQLKDVGAYENTLIIFTSDNGPSFAGGADSHWFDSAGPFPNDAERIKGRVYEGGIRVPMIASWPEHIAPGSVSDHISAFYDVMPTLAEVAGVGSIEGTDGISFLPTLLGDEEQNTHEFLYWEFPQYSGQVAVRIGDWKYIQRQLLEGEPTVELYNLAEDIQESINVAEQHPKIIQQAQAIIKREHKSPELETFNIPVLEAGLNTTKE